MEVTSQININSEITKLAVFIVFMTIIVLFLFIKIIVKSRKIYVKKVKEKRIQNRKIVYRWT